MSSYIFQGSVSSVCDNSYCDFHVKPIGGKNCQLFVVDESLRFDTKTNYMSHRGNAGLNA